MTLHQLKIFVAMARRLNVTRASEELHISQPSVSKQLRLLEQACGVKLYRVVGRRIELTETGRLFLGEAQPLLVKAEDLETKFRPNVAHAGAGSLSVCGTHGPSASFLPSLLLCFRQSHPGVDLTLRTETSHAAERLVLTSQVEIAVVTNPSYSPGLIYQPCRKERLVILAANNHPIAKKRNLTLAELAMNPFVMRRVGADEVSSAEQILNQIETRGYKVNRIMKWDTTYALKAAVKTGNCLGILYWDLAEAEIKARELKAIEHPELKMDVQSFTVYHKGRLLSSTAESFLDLLRKCLLTTETIRVCPPPRRPGLYSEMRKSVPKLCPA
ncbi:MAG: LysR family transcriptional regulator [Deltaproteobacteria bacterium]|nr:LysR family transcriptional regulator [Deltaproteobacteria bacterium]